LITWKIFIVWINLMTWMELLTQMKNWSHKIIFIIWMKWEHLDENDEFDKTWHWMWMKPMKMAECYVTNEINDMDETRPCEWTRMKMLVNTSMELGPIWFKLITWTEVDNIDDKNELPKITTTRLTIKIYTWSCHAIECELVLNQYM
jgi:hypothetical protein